MRTTYSQAQFLQAIHITKLIGDSSNLLILFELMNFGEKSFNELKRMTGINSVTLSKKLSLLKIEGIIDSHASGIENHYLVTYKAEALRPLMNEIEKLIQEDSKLN